MKIVIIGNGILGLTTAYKLIQKNKSVKISLVGPFNHRGCASLAAAAMLNSFCELEKGTLENKVEKEKFIFNTLSTHLWPKFLNDIQEKSGIDQESGTGTYLINNHSTNLLEDENFEAIIDGLKKFNEPYEVINPKTIPNYSPTPNSRASRAIYLKREGWVNPIKLIDALKQILKQSTQVEFINSNCISLNREKNKIIRANLDNKKSIQGDIYHLSPGATFSQIIKNSNLNLNLPQIFYGVGSSILIKTSSLTLSNCVRTPNRGFACGLYATPQGINHTLIGASNFVTQTPEDYVRITSAYNLLKSSMEQLNTNYYRSQLVKINVGWRPVSEDTIPMIGSTSISNLYIATGTKRDGLHCSPVISDYISDLILEKKSKYNLALFKPERNLIRIYTRSEAINKAVKHTINAAYQHDFVSPKNRMLEDLTKYYTKEFEDLHDKVDAQSWGIPPELISLYKYNTQTKSKN